VKKPPKPSRFAEDDEDRNREELRRQETLARLEEELRRQQGPEDAAQRDGDPYNTAGRTRGAWENGKKR